MQPPTAFVSISYAQLRPLLTQIALTCRIAWPEDITAGLHAGSAKHASMRPQGNPIRAAAYNILMMYLCQHSPATPPDTLIRHQARRPTGAHE